MNARNTIRIVIVLSLFVWVTSAADASIIPLDEFIGSLSETWESFPTSQGEEDFLPDPTIIMGGAASVSNPFMIIYEPGVRSFGLGTSGNAEVFDGLKGMGLGHFETTGTLIFEVPVVRFGAYWGAWTDLQIGGDPALVAVNFLDESDVLIGAEVFDYSRSQQGDGLLEWHGWFSTIGIKTLTYSEDKVVIDSLQADPIPEPAMVSLLAFVALFLRHKNRRS